MVGGPDSSALASRRSDGERLPSRWRMRSETLKHGRVTAADILAVECSPVTPRSRFVPGIRRGLCASGTSCHD